LHFIVWSLLKARLQFTLDQLNGTNVTPQEGLLFIKFGEPPPAVPGTSISSSSRRTSSLTFGGSLLAGPFSPVLVQATAEARQQTQDLGEHVSLIR
jgi:hypothetical protein